MDRLRGLLAGQRLDLIDRWNRQLLAAAEAGFALDPDTAKVLPLLLDATDRALQRRFLLVPSGEPATSADAQRAAMQGSMLADYLYDTVIDAEPTLAGDEQRRLAGALTHACVEVLVRGALNREQIRRRRDSARLARLAHELRNSMTAARLALDLLRRKGGLGDGRAARSLENSLDRLRDGVEDAALDELLSGGDLRVFRVRLGPVLTDTHAAASELGADAKRVQVLLAPTPFLLHVAADPRVVRPAMRGLFRAAIDVVRPGSTIHWAAKGTSVRARIAVRVAECRKLPGNRMPDLPALALARRAARSQGGALTARMGRGEGCEFHFVLPASPPLPAARPRASNHCPTSALGSLE